MQAKLSFERFLCKLRYAAPGGTGITGGNPFYVSEILEAGWPWVPPTVRDAVAARLARASARARRAVESAAVIGARVEPSLLAWV